jgi:hypothetical protein
LVRALAVVKGETGKPKPVKKVEVPRTLNDHATKAYSEFFEACTKVTMPGELETLDATLGRMADNRNAAGDRLKAGRRTQG